MLVLRSPLPAALVPAVTADFLELLRDRIQEVLLLVTAKQRPAKVLVSILYYPGVSTGTGSWADPTLAALGYNDAPEKLQLIIRTLISRIKATGGKCFLFWGFWCVWQYPHKRVVVRLDSPLSPGPPA